MTYIETQFEIGTLTNLSDEAWRKAFLATLDNGAMTHDSYCFIRDNRYPNDCEDAMLEEYEQLCFENNNDF